MIKFSHQGQEVSVSFFRGEKSVEDLKRDGILSSNHRVPDTKERDAFVRRCTGVRINIAKQDGGRETIAQGISVCNPRDAFRVGEGRQIALKNAIKTNRQNKQAKHPISKEFSTLLWEEYFQSHSDGVLDNGRRISATNARAIADRKASLRAKVRARRQDEQRAHDAVRRAARF